MSWDAIGALAELLSAVGVIVSLLYLASQIRLSNRMAAVQAKLDATRMLNDYVDSLIRSPELNDLWRRGVANGDALSRDDYVRFSNMALKAFWYFSASHFQYRLGTLADDSWHEILAVMNFWTSGTGTRYWWHRNGRSMFGPEFVAFVDQQFDVVTSRPN